MNRRSVVGVVAAVAVVLLAGCTGADAPPGPDGPALSLAGARGVSADVQRTVTEISGGTETVLSVVDTTVWAPFDERGAALASSPEAGIPGPVGRLAAENETGAGAEWSRYGSFLDSTGVLHELWLSGKGRGLLERMRYRRQGVTVLEYAGEWANVTGGAVRQTEAMTFYPPDAPALRVDVSGRQVRVASVTPFDGLLAAGAQVSGLLGPQPLAAQFYFGECSKEWLGWGGAALLAELAWLRFLKFKTYKNFKLAMAATGAAGIALDKLVDCMMEQAEEPDPGV